jgi:hypothetical protein
VHTGFLLGKVRGRDHLEDIDLDGRIILNGFSGSTLFDRVSNMIWLCSTDKSYECVLNFN